MKLSAKLLQKVEVNVQQNNSRHAENADNQAMNKCNFYRDNSDKVYNVKNNCSRDAVFQKPKRELNYFYQRENNCNADKRRDENFQTHFKINSFQ